MKRRRFILTTLVAAPLVATAHRQADPPGKGFKTIPGEGRLHGHMQLKGVNVNILDMKVSGKDTNGNLAIFEQTSLSPKRGTPLHIHPNQDEVFQVLEGSYIFQVGPDRFSLKPGESIFMPRNVPHAWTQLSDTGKMTVIFQPAGKMEEFFVTMSSLSHEPDQAEIARIFAANDMKLVGPPLKVD